MNSCHSINNREFGHLAGFTNCQTLEFCRSGAKMAFHFANVNSALLFMYHVSQQQLRDNAKRKRRRKKGSKFWYKHANTRKQ